MAIATWGGDREDDRLRALRLLELEQLAGDIDHRFAAGPDSIEKEQKFPQPGDRCARCGDPRERHRAAYAFGPAPVAWLLCYVMNEHLDELRRDTEWPASYPPE